jgi:trypsin-like peptidase
LFSVRNMFFLGYGQIYPFTPSAGCGMLYGAIHVPRRTVVKTSSKGRLYLDWEPEPMTRVPDEYLECVVYLYPDLSSAEAGEKVGGTGFIVRIDQGGHEFYYVVTNKHVVDGGNTCVRFNTVSGIHEAFDFDERNWVRSQDADLAVYCLIDPDPKHVRFRPVMYSQFLTDEKSKVMDLGIGNEVFFAGRFINAEGKDRNRPSLRFGTIAQAQAVEIDEEESFLVEARSIPGYSGSPVFVYLMAGAPFSVVDNSLRQKGVGPFLYGVDWAHLFDYEDAYDERGNKLSFKVRSNSGMMAVVPWWKLGELLFSSEVYNVRQEKEMAPRAASPDSRAVPPSKDAPPANDANPNHRGDFMRLVGAAARKQEPEG